MSRCRPRRSVFHQGRGGALKGVDTLEAHRRERHLSVTTTHVSRRPGQMRGMGQVHHESGKLL